MAKQEITLKGLDGHEDHLVYDAADGQISGSLEDCARSLFPAEGETTPRLRFQGFEGEWVSTRLCEISKKVTTKNTDLKYKITLTNSAEYGIINQLDFFDHDISNGDNIRAYFVVEPDDFVYNPRISVTAPVGPINRNQLGYAGVMSPLYYVFRVNGIDKDYLSYYFKTKLWHKFMYDNGNSGARFDRFSISDEVFGQMPVLHPLDVEEQKAIASFLRRLDSQISLKKSQYERLLQLKSACLGSMFPRESQITPPIRFKGYDGEWVKSLLGDIFTERNESNIHGEMLSVTMNQGIIKASENGRYDTSNSDKSHYKVVKVNDIAYNSMRMWQGASGCSPYEGIVSPAYTVVTPVEGIDSDFFAYLFKTTGMINLFKLNSQGLTSDNWNLKYPAFSKIEAVYPSEIKEQEQIAKFFHRIDSKITAEQQQLDKLKQMKSACLRSMFPQNGGGGNLPLIRFKKYCEAWILHTFSDIAERVSASGKSGLLPGIEFEDIISGQGELNKNVYEKKCIKSGNMFKKDDVLFGKLRPYLKNILLATFEGVAIGDFWVLRPKDVEPYLLYLLVSSEQFMEVANISSGSKMPRADWNLVSKSQFLLPASYVEQKRIASFFRTLDAKISLQTQRIEKLKQLKFACLNKMIA